MNCWYCQDAGIFAFPVNFIAALFLIVGIWTLHRYYSHTRLVSLLTGMPATLTISILIITLLIIEGIWAYELFRTWIFILLQLLLLIILGLIILKRVKSISIRNILFLLNHAGLWIALSAALLGAADREEYKMIAPLGQYEYNAIAPSGSLHPLPFQVRLDKFELEYYSQSEINHVPKCFRSTLTFKRENKEQQTTIEVNHPAHFKGYSLYQDGYDQSRGSASQYTILLIVKDPWIGIVYVGIFMLLAGAVGLIIYGPIKKTKQ